MLDALYASVPGLRRALEEHPFISDRVLLWDTALRRLLKANAPSGGAGLPGGIGDEIATIVEALGLKDRFIPEIGSTGCAGIWIGAQKEAPDIVIPAHMDRPTFKVKRVQDGTLYPICAIRFPANAYHVKAKAMRFDDGWLNVAALGTMMYNKQPSAETLVFQVETGELRWYDLITMDVEPSLQSDVITGTGLDNCLGVVTALGAAAALREIEGALAARNRRVLFVFTDLEEGNPEAFFGHGAARLTYAMPPPTYGVIICDAQSASPDSTPVLGEGASHGSVSAWGRGSTVPPHYLALAVELSAALNGIRPRTVQMNTDYLSRSDDLALNRWTKVLGMIGAPMLAAHTGHESAWLPDIQSAIWWLTHFTMASLGLSPELNRAFALGHP